MNKAELINLMVDLGHSKTDKSLTKAEAERALDLVTRSILKAIEQGKGVSLIGFGSFEVQHRAARDGRNPKTGEKMRIAAYKQPVFKAGSKMKEASNS
ncbi:HU family DNA-binding protein [Rickettsia endosymbiont of Halotydeus destructor]|uniref:HU family DNA-binding protein n=1 Tax=Rickettsia endosymbiont of Halotydeus destructor TaxID=2996754 RepID=UPI003BAE4DA3